MHGEDVQRPPPHHPCPRLALWDSSGLPDLSGAFVCGNSQSAQVAEQRRAPQMGQLTEQVLLSPSLEAGSLGSGCQGGWFWCGRSS